MPADPLNLAHEVDASAPAAGAAQAAPSRSGRNLLRLGGAGLLVTVLCCFTPALVLLLAALGLTAWVAYADWMLLPLALVSLVLLGLGIQRLRAAKAACARDADFAPPPEVS